ncbi:coagulation factor 5/8 type domain-containing protein, partial [Streptomyces sp. SID7803]|nr:coagulation factor 5/8 type domain-containing protein [Streptomyces sp. SID7803]
MDPPSLRRPASSTGRRRTGVLAAVAGLVVSLLAFVPSTSASAAPSCSRRQDGDHLQPGERRHPPATAAVDGDNGTRWSSAFSDPPVDQGRPGHLRLGEPDRAEVGAAYAKSYKIEFSTDNSTWSTAYSTTTAPGGNETLNVSGTARYVRLT